MTKLEAMALALKSGEFLRHFGFFIFILRICIGNVAVGEQTPFPIQNLKIFKTFKPSCKLTVKRQT